MSDERFLEPRIHHPRKSLGSHPWSAKRVGIARRRLVSASLCWGTDLVKCLGFASKLWGGLGMYIKPLLDPIHILAGRIPGGHAKWVEWLNGSSKKHQKPKWFTYLLLWSKIGVVSFETLVFASKIFRCWRLIVPVFRCFVPWKRWCSGGGSQSRSEEDYRSLWPSQGRCFLPRPFCGSGDVKSCEPNNSEVGFHRVSTNKKGLEDPELTNQKNMILSVDSEFCCILALLAMYAPRDPARCRPVWGPQCQWRSLQDALCRPY